jgi:hypothetical protein
MRNGSGRAPRDPAPRRRSGAAARAALAVAAGLALLGPPVSIPAAAGGPLRVTIQVPAPARIDTQGLRTVLVTSLVVERALSEVELSGEMISLLRRELRKKSPLEILDVEAPPLPEQPFRDLLANTGFWRRLAEEHGADLVISGTAGMTSVDRSGFVTRDEISPITGQRVRRTVFVDREALTLTLHLFFLGGRTGQVLYEDRFSAETTLPGRHNDRLTALYNLFEQFEDGVLGIVVPRTRTAQRFLFTD